MEGESPELSEDLLVQKTRGKTADPLCLLLRWDMSEDYFCKLDYRDNLAAVLELQGARAL